MMPTSATEHLRRAWQGLAPLRRRALLALLALLLVQAQGLGLWHRVAHGAPQAVAAVSVAEAGHQTHQAHHARHDPHGPSSLFGHDAGDDSGCRLFDQLAAGDGLLAAPTAHADTEPPALVAVAVAAPRAGRGQRPYQARAPPQA